jgi:hypothetical protein
MVKQKSLLDANLDLVRFKMNRRKFLLTSSIAGLTATHNNISFGINYDNHPSIKANENSVIYLFLNGGPTHIETFNPIPNSTTHRKSIIGSLSNKATIFFWLYQTSRHFVWCYTKTPLCIIPPATTSSPS